METVRCSPSVGVAECPVRSGRCERGRSSRNRYKYSFSGEDFSLGWGRGLSACGRVTRLADSCRARAAVVCRARGCYGGGVAVLVRGKW